MKAKAWMRNSLAAATGVALLGFAASANAASIDFNVEPGNADAGTVGLGTFTADQLTGPYNAEVDQDAAGNFTETGVIDLGVWSLDGSALSSSSTGLGDSAGGGYQMYAMFTAAGTASNPAAGVISVSFNSFLAEIWVDPNFDTTQAFDVSPAGDQSGFTGQAGSSQFADAGANAAHTLATTGDDVLVLEIVGGDLLAGEAALIGPPVSQTVLGTFEVSSLFNTDFGAAGNADDFFQFSYPISSLSLLATGQTGTETGIFPFGPVTDATFELASVDISFQPIPEPASLGLMGVGLLGMGAFATRRKRKA